MSSQAADPSCSSPSLASAAWRLSSRTPLTPFAPACCAAIARASSAATARSTSTTRPPTVTPGPAFALPLAQAAAAAAAAAGSAKSTKAVPLSLPEALSSTRRQERTRPKVCAAG